MPDIWQLLAGLGIFIYAMRVLESGLRGMSSGSLRRLLRRQTRTPARGALIGTVTTAFLQSSSLVSLLVVAFVGAGILPLQNALGVILGANLGTTATGWLVTAIGFKMNIASYTLAIVAIGSVGFIASKPASRYQHRFAVVLGIGLLLLGLGWMKSSMAFIADQIDPEIFRNYPLVVYFAGGVVFTALVQSSSATMVIVLSAVFADLVPLPTAAAIIVGSDLGTTSTVILGALRASNSAKRVALAHFTFNLTVDVIAVIFLTPLLALVTGVFGIVDPMYALVCFHSLFNVLGVLVFLPLTGVFARWLERRFQHPTALGSSRLGTTSPTVPEAALRAVYDEALDLCIKAVLLNTRALEATTPKLLKGSRTQALDAQLRDRALTYEAQYQDIKTGEEAVLRYSQRVGSNALAPPEQTLLSNLLSAVRSASYAAKSLKDVRANLLDLNNQADATALVAELRSRGANIHQLVLDLLEQPQLHLGEERIRHIQAANATAHDELHRLMADYDQHSQGQLSLPTLFNINREVFVANQSLANAVEILASANRSLAMRANSAPAA